ncbi:hypothetical protein ACFFX1_10665 [Dactylosporangium sucinum]|uniref:Uncharacterized protein n=1 Tax=Dactylosporangium sucinum TaxID=1424081 RepID=A0A917THK3_9ACTN|nr:hypothetical protein [Dactylosporangium sucinum]GGM23207.1 hypothetical protein GCM10007977_025510 [Dactylosporangium sucinum]
MRRRSIEFQPGTRVHYHGHMVAEHGIYTVGPRCPCDPCWAAEIDFGVYADVYHVLLRDGRPVLEHVDERSLTALPDD